jgi:hypothetical protein
MMLDDLLTDVEACLDECQHARDRMELLHSLILHRDHMGLSTEQASRHAALLIRDSLGWLDTCRDLLGLYPTAIAKQYPNRTCECTSVTTGESSQG